MHPILSLALAIVLAPTAVFAHSGPGNTHAFSQGLLHPIGGLDHVLAMVLVGVFASQLGGRALWFVPASFVTVMAAGGAFAMAGGTVPHLEMGITLSIVVLGTVIALAVKAPLVLAMGVVGFFAIFHGHAHGTETPADIGGIAYAAGFVGTTALLHGAGLSLGVLMGRGDGPLGSLTVRVGSGAVALVGVGLLVGAV